jgi:hypothetical protein
VSMGKREEWMRGIEGERRESVLGDGKERGREERDIHIQVQGNTYNEMHTEFRHENFADLFRDFYHNQFMAHLAYKNS